MKKNYLYIIIILVFIFEILTNSNSIMESVSTSFNIWKNSLFPALFPMFVFSSILIDLGIIEIIAKSKSNILKKIFNINSSSIFIFIMSMFSGFPSSAKYINELYNKFRQSQIGGYVYMIIITSIIILVIKAIKR